MKISRTLAIAVFAAVGFKTADKWNDARINSKLLKIADNVTEDEIAKIEDEETRKGLKSIMAALEKNETVEVEEAPAKEKAAAKTEVDEDGDPKPAKKKDAGKVAEEKVKASAAKKEPAADEDEEDSKPAKKAVAPKKEKGEVSTDKLGNRVGSQAANINAALSKKWTTEEEVAKAAGVTVARVRGHAKYLEGKKLVEIGDKGVRLV